MGLNQLLPSHLVGKEYQLSFYLMCQILGRRKYSGKQTNKKSFKKRKEGEENGRKKKRKKKKEKQFLVLKVLLLDNLKRPKL